MIILIYVLKISHMVKQDHIYIYFKDISYNYTKLFLYKISKCLIWFEKNIVIYFLKVFYIVEQKYIYIFCKNVIYSHTRTY